MSLNSGSCWDILEIEATEDKKIIKKAYHKLLRLYKPDEKPDEFKKLYEAYQNALEWEDYDWNEPDFNDLIEEDIDWENEEEDDEEYDEALEKEWEKESALQNDYYVRWEKFEEQVDELTYNNNYPELFNQIERWKFLEELDVGSDLEFYKEASGYLFSAVTNFDEKHPTLLLNEEVIRYFDKVFLWKKQWQTFDVDTSIFDYLEIKKVIPLTQEERLNKYQFAPLSKRLQAFLIDIIIAITLLLVMNRMEIDSIDSVLVSYFGIQALLVWFLGFKSLGHFVLRLEVLEGKDKEPPSRTARGLRLILTMLSLMSILMLIEDPMHNLLYLIVIFANMILFFYYARFLQDYSATRVYKLNS